MSSRARSGVAALAGVIALLWGGAATACARDAIVTSFDGTPISVTLHPAAGLQPGERAPSILQTHGWGGSRERDGEAASDETTGLVGVGPLRHAGFNVLTWDSRGFGESGGTVQVDAPDAEGRDVQSLLDWLARQPEASLDGPGDPRVGMHGISYAGGIELVAAGLDGRIDAIAPGIAWHSLLTSLYKEDTVKGGWSSLLVGSGLPSATLEGAVSPAGVQTGTLDPHIMSAFTTGLTTGRLSDEDRAWFESRGPGDALVSRIRVPTLLVQGTADTLFTPTEAIRNEAILRAGHVPVRMLWFCGGHGVCNTGAGAPGHVERRVVDWLRHTVAGDDTPLGPRFEWLADDARWRSAPSFPPRSAGSLTTAGAGTLAISPADALSGTPIAAGPAANAITIPLPAPARSTQAVGEPRLELSYSGTGTATHAFAQIVDQRRGLVLGNQVTPIPIVLDGAPHTVSRPLEGIAAALDPGSQLSLQIVGGSQVYGPVRGAGVLQVGRAALSVPLVTAAG